MPTQLGDRQATDISRPTLHLEVPLPEGVDRGVNQQLKDGRKEDINMADTTDLERKIKEKPSLSEERQHLQREHLQRQMAEAQARDECYTALADRLMQEVIGPRMEKLEALFDNARMSEARCSRRTCCCEFTHTPRFPATASLEIAITHDREIETVVLQFQMQILPVFFPLPGQDRLTMLLNEADEGKVNTWVEAKILAFVDSYLRLETSKNHRDENIVTDPVCGMWVNRAFAPAQMTYGGRTSYFCVPECRARFAENPVRYLGG
jgi:YHS domain-containing protein